MSIKRSDLKILYSLYKEGCFTEFYSITASKLCELSEFKGTKVRATAKVFVQEGYAGNGIPRENASTFYITEKGIELLREMMPEEALDRSECKE